MPESNQCITCLHYWGGFKCDAFPEAIPEDVLSGLFDHSSKHPQQQNDVVREEGDPYGIPEEG